MQKWTRPVISLLGLFLSFVLAGPALAHPLDVAYLDLGKATSTTLTVAIHPYQAFELVRGGSIARFDLKKLQAAGDIVSAYVQDHVEVSSSGKPCSWDAGPASTPQSEIEAVADGVTVAGALVCPGETRTLHIKATLFIDGFPTQTNIIRFELPDGFADRVTLDHKTVETDIDISELFATSSAQTVPHATSTARAGGDYAALAVKALGGDLAWWQVLWLLGSVCVVGALHALGPGHGKSLMAAAMLGQKPSFKKAILLGGVIAGTHVSDVFLMSLVAGGLSAALPPGRLLSFLGYLSAIGLCVMGIIGLATAISRYRRVGHDALQAQLDDDHARAHALGLPHAHEDDHRHFKKALWTGFVGSLAPCPTAWAIFMATLSIGKWGMGLALLIAFSIGLSATVIGLGCLMVVSAAFMRSRTPPRLTYAMPVISSAVICLLGAWLLWRAL